MEPRPPWYDRVINDLPPLPRWCFPVCVVVMVFLLGVLVGLLLCINHQVGETTTAFNQRVLEYRLNALDQRLKALEQRNPAP